jgi:hypothetical protein
MKATLINLNMAVLNITSPALYEGVYVVLSTYAKLKLYLKIKEIQVINGNRLSQHNYYTTGRSTGVGSRLGKRFVSLPTRPDWFWGPPNLLEPMGYQRL